MWSKNKMPEHWLRRVFWETSNNQTQQYIIITLHWVKNIIFEISVMKISEGIKVLSTTFGETHLYGSTLSSDIQPYVLSPSSASARRNWISFYLYKSERFNHTAGHNTCFPAFFPSLKEWGALSCRIWTESTTGQGLFLRYYYINWLLGSMKENFSVVWALRLTRTREENDRSVLGFSLSYLM